MSTDTSLAFPLHPNCSLPYGSLGHLERVRPLTRGL
jgi:hypothetical protein